MVKQIDMCEDRPDVLITDFTDPVFQAAFKQYFAELTARYPIYR